LSDDCAHFRPVAGAYSPYGILYGFSSDLIEHMALKTLQPDAMSHFGLEDVFAGGDENGDKLAWVSGWRKLPHLTPEVQRLFEYPQQFAEDVFDRIGHALGTRESAAQTGRLFIVPDHPEADSKASPFDSAQGRLIPDLPAEYIKSSDESERREGKYLVSYQTPGGWVAITKTILTEVLGAGRDVKIVGLPAVAVGVLKLMCPALVVLPADMLISARNH
jgi:hypothetical protein